MLVVIQRTSWKKNNKGMDDGIGMLLIIFKKVVDQTFLCLW